MDESYMRNEKKKWPREMKKTSKDYKSLCRIYGQNRIRRKKTGKNLVFFILFLLYFNMCVWCLLLVLRNNRLIAGIWMQTRKIKIYLLLAENTHTHIDYSGGDNIRNENQNLFMKILGQMKKKITFFPNEIKINRDRL